MKTLVLVLIAVLYTVALCSAMVFVHSLAHSASFPLLEIFQLFR